VRAEKLDRKVYSFGFQILQQANRQRVHLLARGTTWHPDANRLAGASIANDPRKHLLLERLEHVGIAEKPGDVDQQVLEQRLRLRGIALQKSRVTLQRVELVHHHAAPNAPLKGVGLVMRE